MNCNNIVVRLSIKADYSSRIELHPAAKIFDPERRIIKRIDELSRIAPTFVTIADF